MRQTAFLLLADTDYNAFVNAFSAVAPNVTIYLSPGSTTTLANASEISAAAGVPVSQGGYSVDMYRIHQDLWDRWADADNGVPGVQPGYPTGVWSKLITMEAGFANYIGATTRTQTLTVCPSGSCFTTTGRTARAAACTGPVP